MVYKFKNHEIEIYDSIQNLPVLRFQKFNKYQMIASEIGNDFADYDKRTEKALAFLHKNMVQEAIQELNNRRQTVFNAYNEFTPIGKSFAVLIKRIDKQVYEMYAPDDLDAILKHLNDIGFNFKTSMIKLREVKKKIETELVVYYPNFFPKNTEQNKSYLRVSRVNAMLDMIINNDDSYSERVFEIEKEILEDDKPNIWNVWQDNNMERVLEVDFQKFGISVMELSGQNLTEITTFTFYATVEHLKEKFKKNK
jgi:hypothetical protein